MHFFSRQQPALRLLVLAGLLGWSAAQAQAPGVHAAQAPAVQIDSFSPQGEVRSVQQIAIRFSQDMVRLGAADAAAPVAYSCQGTTPTATSRWVDTRRWVVEFASNLPPGVRCDARLKDGLKSLAGAAVPTGQPWQFTTGGPKVDFRHPDAGAQLKENEIFLLHANAPVNRDSLAQNLSCVVGNETRPAVLLPVTEARAAWAAVLKQRIYMSHAYNESVAFAASCGPSLPNDAQVRIVWGKAVATPSGVASAEDQSAGSWKVRPLLRADVECAQLDGTTGCDPRRGLAVEFSEDVPADYLKKVEVRTSAGTLLKTEVPLRYQALSGRTVQVIDAPDAQMLAEGSALTVALPSGLKDVDGRALANAGDFPRRVMLATLPPYIGFTQLSGVLPYSRVANAPVQWPLAVRRAETSVPVRYMRIGGETRAGAGTGAGGDSLAMRAAASAGAVALWTGAPRWPQQYGTSTVAYPVINSQQLGWAESGTRNVATQGTVMEFAGVPFPEPGLYLVEAHSPAFTAYLARVGGEKTASRRRPQERAALVQVTNLNISTRSSGPGGSGASIIWVTALDTGLPVAGASVDVLGCDGKPVAQGDTDARGIFTVEQSVPAPDCAQNNTSANSLLVVVRQGKDLAVLVDDSSRRYAYSRGPQGAASTLSHTILDRTLFKAGDTVYMQHLTRKATPAGFGFWAASTGKAEIRFEGELIATLPLAWDANGQATSQWKVPPGARLGEYFVAVQGPGGVHTSMFSVEEFRMPVFDAALKGTPTWSAGTQELPLTMSLAYLAGGAAAGQKVELKGTYNAGAEPPVAGYSFGDVTLPRWAPVPLRPVDAQLDAKGLRTLNLTLPPLDRPVTLSAEMTFSDPNGEVQTIGQRFALWHVDVRLGLSVTSRPEPGRTSGTAITSAVVLDASGKPLAGRAVQFSWQSAEMVYGNGEARIRTFGAETMTCNAATAADGKAECATPGLADSLPQETSSYNTGWLFRVRSTDTAGKPTSSSVFIHRYTLSYAGQNKLLLLNDAEPLKAGVPASLTVFAPFLPATLLLTVERDGVYSSAVHQIPAASSVIQLPLLASQAPNVQIHARFVRGLAELPPPAENVAAPPVSADQSISVRIAPTAFALDVRVEPAVPSVLPRGTVSMKVSATRRADGSPATGARVTLAVVDEALLALRDNPTWQLLEIMTRNRSVLVTGKALDPALLRTVRIGPQPAFNPLDDQGRTVSAPPPAPAPVAAMSARMAKDGAAEAPGATPPRSQFSSLAFWTTEVVLDAQGHATVAVPFNDSLTRWRVVAVAMQDADMFGTGQSAVIATQPVQIFSGLPPIVRSGDRLNQQVTIRNGGEAGVALRVKAQPAFAQAPGFAPAAQGAVLPVPVAPALGALDRQVRLEPGQAQTLAWTLALPPVPGTVTWLITALTPDGKTADSIQVTQVARPALDVTVRQATLLQVDGSVTVPFIQPARALAGMGGIEVSLQDSLVTAALGEVKKWMADYPYACLEQSSSKIAVSGDRAAWDLLMAELPKYLDGDGLARFFPQNELPGSEILTAHLLDVASARAWPIPADAQRKMTGGLQRILAGRLAGKDWLPTGSNGQARLLALQATLAERGALPDMTKLGVRPDDIAALPTVALTDWARALLAQAPQHRSAADLQNAGAQLRSRYDVQGTRLNWRNEDRENWWWFMWNGDLTAARTALVLQKWQAVDPGWKSDLPLVIKGLVGRQKFGRWSTTTANVWATLALQKFADSTEKGAVSGTTQVRLKSRHQAAQAMAWPAPAPLLLPFPAQRAGDDLLITQQGAGAPWATVSIKAAVRLDRPVIAGMRVEKSITAVEQKVKGQWSVGDVARIRLTMQSQADMTWVVVDDPVPSGATILGRGLARESAMAQAGQTSSGWAWPSYTERAAVNFRGYYRWVPRGTWSTEYTVRINNAGRFSFPPTRMEAMYAPEIFAETPNADWVVRD